MGHDHPLAARLCGDAGAPDPPLTRAIPAPGDRAVGHGRGRCRAVGQARGPFRPAGFRPGALQPGALPARSAPRGHAPDGAASSDDGWSSLPSWASARGPGGAAAGGCRGPCRAGGAIGPRSRTARTAAANSAATGAGMLPSHARWTSTIRADSAVRRSRSLFECLVMSPRFDSDPGCGASRDRTRVRAMTRAGTGQRFAGARTRHRSGRAAARRQAARPRRWAMPSRFGAGAVTCSPSHCHRPRPDRRDRPPREAPCPLRPPRSAFRRRSLRCSKRPSRRAAPRRSWVSAPRPRARQSLTLTAFGAAVENAAARLAAALEPRTRVMVQGAPGPGFAAALFAAARADVVLVPLDVRMTSDTIDRIAALTEPSAILLGFGSTLEPATIPRLAGLPILDLDDLVDPAPPAAVAALARAGPPTRRSPSRSCARRGPRATRRASRSRSRCCWPPPCAAWPRSRPAATGSSRSCPSRTSWSRSRGWSTRWRPAPRRSTSPRSGRTSSRPRSRAIGPPRWSWCRRSWSCCSTPSAARRTGAAAAPRSGGRSGSRPTSRSRLRRRLFQKVHAALGGELPATLPRPRRRIAIATDAQPGALLAARYQLTENITRGPAISLEGEISSWPAVAVYLDVHAHCDPAQIEHYLANAVSAGQLGHPAVAATFDAHTPGDVSYVVREWVDGVDLGSILEDGPLTGSQIRATLLPVAELLAEAHARGLTHGRLRPCDVFVTQHSGIKVLDSGTCWSSLGMTFAEAQNEDVTALGALIYAAATGRWPLPASPDSPNLPAAPVDEAGRPCLPRQVRRGECRGRRTPSPRRFSGFVPVTSLHTASGVAHALAAMSDDGLSARSTTTTARPLLPPGWRAPRDPHRPVRRRHRRVVVRAAARSAGIGGQSAHRPARPRPGFAGHRAGGHCCPVDLQPDLERKLRQSAQHPDRRQRQQPCFPAGKGHRPDCVTVGFP